MPFVYLYSLMRGNKNHKINGDDIYSPLLIRLSTTKVIKNIEYIEW